MNSFIRYSGTDRIPYTYINKGYSSPVRGLFDGEGCARWSPRIITVLRCIYNKAVENGEAAFIPSLFKGGFYGVWKASARNPCLWVVESPDDCPGKRKKLRKTQLALCLMFQYGGMSFVDFAHLNRVISRTAYWITIARPGPLCGWEVLDTAEAMYRLAGERGGGSGYLFPT